MPLLATLASPPGAQLRENEILAELEAMVDNPMPAHQPRPEASTRHVARQRVLPIFLLIAVSAALAFVSSSARDALMTGRSVVYGTTP